MFYIKKIVTLNLLLTGVIGTSFGFEAAARRTSSASFWAKSPKIKEFGPQIFKSREDLIATCRSHYEMTGTLNERLVESIGIFIKNPTLDCSSAISYVLATHPDSPELRSPSRASSVQLTPRDRSVISPLTLMSSVSPETTK